MREQIRNVIESIIPLDSIEVETKSEVVAWINSGVELCRIEKPAKPNKHLVSYFVLLDSDYLLLVDHINAEKWLPTGGHVEKGEHPRNTVSREAYEELKIKAEFILNNPLLLTSTDTVGKTAGHTDICLWYALKGDKATALKIDKSEFHEARWFHRKALPVNTDPHLTRFTHKFYGCTS